MGNSNTSDTPTFYYALRGAADTIQGMVYDHSFDSTVAVARVRDLCKCEKGIAYRRVTKCDIVNIRWSERTAVTSKLLDKPICKYCNKDYLLKYIESD